MSSVLDEIKEWERLNSLTSVKSVKEKISKHIAELSSTTPNTTISETNGKHNVDRHSNNEIRIGEFSWEQEGVRIKIRIKFTNTSQIDQPSICFNTEKSSISLTFWANGPDNNEARYSFIIPKLHSKIIPSRSTYYLKSNYIVLSIEKESYEHWPSVEYKQSNITKSKVPDANKNSDPNAMLIDLMKNLYQEGDDDMKRTIAKAWTEASEKRQVYN